jgi:alpha-D-ribose 1-methylphosphonate 5-triphosphate synthase subunit PhnI
MIAFMRGTRTPVFTMATPSSSSTASKAVAFRVDDGYLISLPYGAHRDWVRNVQAAGSCELERGGRRIELTTPMVLAASQGMAQLPAPMRASEVCLT